MAHLVVIAVVVKQTAYLLYNEVMVGTHQIHSAGIERFGTLCGIAHYKKGVGRLMDFLLYSTRIVIGRFRPVKAYDNQSSINESTLEL